MDYRQLGSTGIKVSKVGFGAWQLGNERDWGAMSETDAVTLVQQALERGCNFFDTAPNYGAGNSERLLGKALKGKRSNTVISTKFGHHPDFGLNFDPKLLRPSVESSLLRLDTDYLDTVLLHNPPFECLSGNSGHFDELEKLKREGKIRAYGASVDSSREMLELIRNTESQVIEVMFNIFHQEPKIAFEEASAKGVGLIIKVPLDSGWLSGKYDEKSTFRDIRSRWDEGQLKKRAALLPAIKEILEPGETLVEAALRFVLEFQEVSTVIPGSKNLAQLIENVSAADRGMAADKVEKLEKLWSEELASYPLEW